MSAINDFREYVESSGVNFESLSVEDKRVWRESFDKSLGSSQDFTQAIKRIRVLEESNEHLVKSNEYLVKSNANLAQEVEDLRTILPTRFVDNTEKSSVKILNAANEPVGVGFFFNENTVISCAHNFPELTGKSKEEVTGINFHGQVYGGQQIILRIIGFSDKVDYDLAVFHTEYISNNCLTIGSPRQTETRLAITSFQIGLSHAYRNKLVIPQEFVVVPATLLKISPHHIVYSGNLFSGDSGGAVICARDGTVIGIHLETVN